MKKRIAIIGGGLTGLSAAYYLQRDIRAKNLDIELVLIDKAAKVGGKISSLKRDGYVIELGPDSFLERKTIMADLAKEIGMGDELVHNATGKAYILHHDKLHDIPKGSYMGIPTDWNEFMKSDLVSFGGKMRAARDFVMTKSESGKDQSMGSFFRRRLGKQVFENLIDPLLSGVYGGDLDHMSLMATYPQFYDVEQKYGSLIRGFKRQTKSQQAEAKLPGQFKKNQGIFLSFKNGMESFTDGLEAQLTDVDIWRTRTVESIEKMEKYKLNLDNGEYIIADSLIVATEHQVVAKMFDHYDFLKPLGKIPSTSVATVALAFPKSAVKKDMDGTGFLVTKNSPYTIKACTWRHKKWEYSAPEDKVLLRCFVGRPEQPDVLKLSDEEMIAACLSDLTKIMDIDGEPEFAEVTRLMNSMPQYLVGHKERLAETRAKLTEELPGVYLAGMSYDGVGMPDSIQSGKNAVDAALEFLAKK